MSRRAVQSGCVQKDGKWYVVRYGKEIAGQEKRQRVWQKFCPISGPGKLSASERERKAREIIAASGVDMREYFDRMVKQSAPSVVTFRQQADIWLEEMRNRDSEPLAPSTIAAWAYALEKWINVNIGGLLLESVNNLAMRELVAKMVKGGLSPKSVANYAQIVNIVVPSATDEQGEQMYPRKWSNKLIRMPKVKKKKQRTPTFTGDVVTGIIRETEEQKYFVLFALCASTGLRFGEAFGIDISNVSPDCRTIKIVQKAWGSELQDRLKTESGEREVDLHPKMAAVLRAKRESERKCSLLFASKHGKPLRLPPIRLVRFSAAERPRRFPANEQCSMRLSASPLLDGAYSRKIGCRTLRNPQSRRCVRANHWSQCPSTRGRE